jgi:hypothetical protein
MTGLAPNTTYHVRGYATNSMGASYGDDLTFTTETTTPTVETMTPSSVTATTALCGGDVTSDGGATVTARGICWSTAPNPTVHLPTRTTDGSGTGTFSSSMTGLAPNTTYHVRGYATNSMGASYGDDLTFTTETTTPTVETMAPSSVTTTTALCGGDVTADGGAEVTARGVCWNTTGDPVVGDDHTVDGAGTGSFATTIRGLRPNTTYAVRAYATNAEDTAYGDELSFTTLPSALAPLYYLLNEEEQDPGRQRKQ